MITKLKKMLNSVGLEVSRVRDPNAWNLGIEDYYPVRLGPRWGHGRPPHNFIQGEIERRVDDYENLLKRALRFNEYYRVIPWNGQDSDATPYWNNVWYSTLDAAMLMFFILDRKPKRYVEIGSGFSTIFASYAAKSGGVNDIEIISIDPNPRRDIASISNKVINSSLEDVDLSIFEHLRAGDILFFDGSHRAFSNSDTTTFYLDILPMVPDGVLIHVHDIFWPDDYPHDWSKRLYSEQYLLGAMLVGGIGKYRIVFPSYFVSKHERLGLMLEEMNIPKIYPGTDKPGLSFWFEKVLR